MDWIGRQEIVQEQLDAQRVLQLANSLSRSMDCQAGVELPTLSH